MLRGTWAIKSDYIHPYAGQGVNPPFHRHPVGNPVVVPRHGEGGRFSGGIVFAVPGILHDNGPGLRQVLPAEAVEQMYGKEFPLRSRPFYCMGLKKWQTGGKMICEHSGGLHGVSTQGGFVEGGYAVAVLCNEGDLDMDAFQWPCYNYILGLPLDTKHFYAMPSGKKFSRPDMLCGDFLSKEGLPVHCAVRIEDGELTADYRGKKVRLLYCSDARFAAVEYEHPENRVETLRFYIKNGTAWGVKCGSRIYQRTGTDR